MTSAAAAPAASLAATLVVVLGSFGAILFVLEGLVLALLERCFLFLVFLDERLEARHRRRAWTGAGDAHLGAFFLALGQDFDGHAVAFLNLGEIRTLGIEQIHSRLGGGVERDRCSLAFGCLVFDQAQRG